MTAESDRRTAEEGKKSTLHPRALLRSVQTLTKLFLVHLLPLTQWVRKGARLSLGLELQYGFPNLSQSFFIVQKRLCSLDNGQIRSKELLARFSPLRDGLRSQALVVHNFGDLFELLPCLLIDRLLRGSVSYDSFELDLM